MAISKITSDAIDATGFNLDSDTLTIDSTNNRVGIGTSSPGVPFHVKVGTNENFYMSSDSGVRIQAINDAANAINTMKVGGDPLIFLGTGGTETARIDSSGNVGIGTSPSVKLDIDNGSLKVNRGNSSGDIAVFRGLNAEKVKIDTDGIKFNGDTAAANAIDDYEEGTWTPGITGMTFENAGGAYTKIGRRVQCSGFLINCTSGTASSTTAKLSGLPYTVSNTLSITSLEDGGAFTYFLNLGRSTSFVSIAPDDSSTECFLYFTVGASTGFTSLLRTDLDNSSLSTRFFFTYISI